MTASSASPQEQFPHVRHTPVATDSMDPSSIARVIDFTHFQETGQRVEVAGQETQDGRRYIGLISSNAIDFGQAGSSEAAYTPTRTERVVGAALNLKGAIKETLALNPVPAERRPVYRPEDNARELAKLNRSIGKNKLL
jgi:hypothetical protein